MTPSQISARLLVPYQYTQHGMVSIQQSTSFLSFRIFYLYLVFYLCSPKEKRGKGPCQRLFRVLLLLFCCLAPPADEAVGAHEYSAGGGNAICSAEHVLSINEISCLSTNLIDF